MSTDPTPSLRVIAEPLHDSVRELRHGYQAVCQSMEETLAECESRTSALADCRRQLAEARRSLTESERQLAERIKAENESANRIALLRKHVEARQAELAHANDKILHVQNESAQHQQRLDMQIEQNQQMRHQMERLQAENESARAELAQMRSQFAPLMQSTAEAAQLRADLAVAQGELTRVRQQLAAATADGGLSDKLATVQAERQQLEIELDAVRHRTAEMAAALDEQKRLMVAEREQWSEELRHLRRAVEKQAEALGRSASTGAAPMVVGADPLPPRHTSDTDAEDTVLDAVLEQFEMLQRSKIRKLASTSG